MTPQVSLLPLSGGPHYGVSVLRVFCIAAGVLGEPPAWLLPRLRYDAALRRLLDALTHALTTLKELLLVASLFILITAVVGHLFFASAATAEPATLGSATGFDTFPAALYTAFALMTGANVWQAPMWRAMRTASAGAVIFFVAQELASILLMCLFNAALVRSFAVKEDVVRSCSAVQLLARLLASDARLPPRAVSPFHRSKCRWRSWTIWRRSTPWTYAWTRWRRRWMSASRK